MGTIRHTYYIPPQYYPFLKKLGDDTPELKPYMDKLMNGEMTFDDYEEMFYAFAKPLKIYRPRIPIPYRSAEEMKNTDEDFWDGYGPLFRMALHSGHRQYRIDMKLFYLEAP